MDFGTLIDALFKHPIAGLPFRMIFLCHWHRINATLLIIGGVIYALGTRFSLRWLSLLGLVIGAPACACFALLICLVPVFMLLEHMFPKREQ